MSAISTATSRIPSSSKAHIASRTFTDRGAHRRQYPSIRGVIDMREIVNALSKALQLGKTEAQYLAFEPVTREALAKIDAARTTIGRHTRMSYYADIDLLIVKLMPLNQA